MEILPLDSPHRLDHIRLRRRRAVCAGVCGVCDGGEWAAFFIPRSMPYSLLGGGVIGKRKREREKKKGRGEMLF